MHAYDLVMNKIDVEIATRISYTKQSIITVQLFVNFNILSFEELYAGNKCIIK